MSNYELLRAERNRLFPEALKLEFGVELISPEKHKCVITYKAKPCRKDCSVCLIHFNRKHGKLTFIECASHAEIAKYKILGKPLTLVDIILILQEKWCLSSFSKSAEIYPQFVIEGIVFDLLVPLDHKANDEAFGKVLDLISKK